MTSGTKSLVRRLGFMGAKSYRIANTMRRQAKASAKVAGAWG